MIYLHFCNEYHLKVGKCFCICFKGYEIFDALIFFGCKM